MAKAGRPKKYKSVKLMKEKIDMYFEMCDEKNEPYTVTGLCLALDICRDTLLEYSKDKLFSDTIKRLS